MDRLFVQKDKHAMQCEEALQYWRQQLLGQPVDPEKLEEAFAHIGACQELCARILSTAPDFDLFSSSEQRAGQTDLYEALGLRAEEEGDAHARQWKRLRRLAITGRASQEAIDYERVMALAAWQAAANYYQDGLRISETAFLTEGLKRIRRKRLEPSATARGPTRTAQRGREARTPIRKTSAHPPGAAASGEAPSRLPQDAWPRLKLVAHTSTRQISVEQRPTGWQISTMRSGSPLVIRETPALYQPSTQGAATREPPQVDGTLDPFELALWVSETARKWELDLLVRAETPRHPWSSILLTLEDQEQRLHSPTLMEFDRRIPKMTGWWARLKEVEPGGYHLRLAANNASGQSSEEATLELHLTTEA